MSRTTSTIAALALTLVACKGGDKSKSGGGDTSSAAGGCKIKATKTADLVAGKTAQPIAPFTAMKLGMTVADVKKACPEMFEEEDAKKTGTFSVGDVVGRIGEVQVYGRLDFVDDKLTEITVDAPADLADALTAAWGAPKASAGPAPAHAWHDDATGLRAVLAPADDKTRELSVSAYAPLEIFVELDATRLPFKPMQVLGKTPKELMATFPQYVRPEQVSESTKAATEAMMADMKKEVEAMGVDTTPKPDAVDIRLPATPFATDLFTAAILHQNDDLTVRNYAVWFRTKDIMTSTSWPDEITAIKKLFDDKWGPHKELKRTLGPEAAWFDAKAGIRASAELDPEKPDELDVSYVRYMPLAELFGAPGALWGFEKADRPLLGATPDELVAAYGKAITLDPDGQTAKLTLLPTDYEEDVATTWILLFIHGGKIDQWSTHLDFEAYEPSRAEYEALLTAKFGPLPKPDKYGHMIYKKAKVDIEFSDITHELDIEVSK